MRFSKGVGDVVGPVLIALVFAGYPSAVRAQTTSASVSGAVQDSQGGVLPGVTVTLTSRTQGNVLTAVTDSGGRFVLPVVRPDAYTLKVTLQGFKTLERTNLIVNANDKLTTGPLTLEVGSLSEEVMVTGRVIELQTTSGERSFTLESEALKNIANNGRALFNFATLVPGALSQNTGNTELGSVSGFTVNGQRPNSNNITIDGVANIDTGDNGGNMATTNIDAVAEFKILTNAYQAEYGRAVGGQLQVVTKSGTQAFHGSGYWYGRRSAWDANSYLNKRETPEIPKSDTSRNDSGYTFGGPVWFPGFQRRQEKAVLLLEPGIRATQQSGNRASGRACRRLSNGAAISHRAWTAAAIRSRTFVIPPPACPAAPPIRAAVSRTAASSAGIPANRLYAPGLSSLSIFPTSNFSGGSGLNFTSQVPDSSPRREDLLAHGLPADRQLAGHRARYMKNK